MVTVRPLTLDAFEDLPEHDRTCVFWEVDPDLVPQTPPTGETSRFASEFDKEAWISMLLLEWGTCGQLAVDSESKQATGVAFYAPPGRVPRARWFPTAPVSADAVILTSIRTVADSPGVAVALADAVIDDLISRGVRAIEAFGIIRSAFADSFPDDICAEAMIDADFLKDSGFDLVAPHHKFPRFRLELDEGLGWKAGVELALEKLVIAATLELSGSERIAVPV